MFSKKGLKRKRVGGGGRGEKLVTALDDVRREIAIMTKLDHPNVVKLYEVIDDEEQDRLFMVLEFIEGGAVQNPGTREKPTPMPEEQARRFFRDIIAGLRYCHAQRIIHRDLKPENLLLSNGRIKIADFGVSHIFSERSGDRLARTAGTHAFMAPEMVTDSDYSGRAVDIWAAGVCLWSFIFGNLPFMADNVMDIYRMIREDPIYFPHPVNENLGDLLCGLMEKSPEKRMTMEEVCSHPWVTRNGKEALPEVGEIIQVSRQDMRSAMLKIRAVRFIAGATRRMSKVVESAVRRKNSREQLGVAGGKASAAPEGFTIEEEDERIGRETPELERERSVDNGVDMEIPVASIDPSAGEAWGEEKPPPVQFDSSDEGSDSDSEGLILDDESGSDGSALVLGDSDSESDSDDEGVVVVGGPAESESSSEPKSDDEEDGEWNDEIIAIHGASDEEDDDSNPVGEATPLGTTHDHNVDAQTLARQSSWLNSGPSYVPSEGQSDNEDTHGMPRVVTADDLAEVEDSGIEGEVAYTPDSDTGT